MQSGGHMFFRFPVPKVGRKFVFDAVGQRLSMAAALFVMAAWTHGALAGDVPLSLTEAQRLAVARSRQLVAQDAAVDASHDLAVAARQLPDPVLRIGVDNLPVNGGERY